MDKVANVKAEREILARRPAFRAAIWTLQNSTDKKVRMEAQTEIDRITLANRKSLGIVWPEDRIGGR